MSALSRFFAPCAKGLEGLLVEELRALGAADVRETRAGVAFAGPLATAYRACLWSRLASRILLPITGFDAPSPEALYEGVLTVDWNEHLRPEGTLAVDLNVSDSAITHSRYAALKVKDAMVDQFRARFGVRPSVDTARPDLRVNVYLHRDVATVSVDLAGEALHRRGHRAEGVAAPLKENLAAAILLRARWPELAARGDALVDPMCGSGTLPIEAALLAADIAPGLARDYFGFLGWRGHDPDVWRALLDEARERRAAGLERLPPIRGYDHDAAAVKAARINVTRAGLTGRIEIERRSLADCRAETVSTGLVVANPPYGERLGDLRELPALYAELGDALKRCYGGWAAAVFTGNPDLGKHMGLRAHRMHTLWNGAIECRLLHFDIRDERFVRGRETAAEAGAGADMFANRLRKDLRHFGRWARRQDIGCYRVYDADLHEYNLAIDVYESDRRYVHVQEYAPPLTLDPRKAERRLKEALAVIPEVLAIEPAQMFFKVRERQRRGSQYEKQAESGEFHEVREGPCRFLVNFTDYLDTGLFLDHRATREMLRGLAAGKRFLNLFGYTGTATVHAAIGGAAATTTVDMSRTYLDWARRNFDLNGLARGPHELVQADVLGWLETNRDRRYDLVFLDPPTFSRSKRMEGTLDVQRDHVPLLRDTARLLAPGGLLVFSTNLRRFKLDRDALSGLEIEDITRRTIPKDFERNPRIHHCFLLRRASA